MIDIDGTYRGVSGAYAGLIIKVRYVKSNLVGYGIADTNDDEPFNIHTTFNMTIDNFYEHFVVNNVINKAELENIIKKLEL